MTDTLTSTVPVGAVHAPDVPLDWSESLVPGAVVRDDRVAPLAPWSAVVRAGEVLTIVDVGGNQSADCLVYDAHDPDERVRLRLLATPAYEVWLLGWTPGQSVGLHDHGDANGAFVVVDGELTETSVVAGRLVDEARTAGAIGRIPVGALHDVTGGWTAPLLLALVLAFGMLAFGLGAGRPGMVQGREA